LQVVSGLRAGAIHAIPFGEMTIGTTLDSDFFIGCLDTWHQLLRANPSTNQASMTARNSADEQLMLVRIRRGESGIQIHVDKGFAEILGRRLLPGDTEVVAVGSVIHIGSARLEIQCDPSLLEDDTRALQRPGVVNRRIEDQAKPYRAAGLLGRTTAIASVTVLSVMALCVAIVFKDDIGASDRSAIVATTVEDPLRLVNVDSSTGVPSLTLLEVSNAEVVIDAAIHDQRIVAIVSSSPAFVMTESGELYGLGAKVDDGYQISDITESSVTLLRGKKSKRLIF